MDNRGVRMFYGWSKNDIDVDIALMHGMVVKHSCWNEFEDSDLGALLDDLTSCMSSMFHLWVSHFSYILEGKLKNVGIWRFAFDSMRGQVSTILGSNPCIVRVDSGKVFDWEFDITTLISRDDGKIGVVESVVKSDNVILDIHKYLRYFTSKSLFETLDLFVNAYVNYKIFCITFSESKAGSFLRGDIKQEYQSCRDTFMEKIDFALANNLKEEFNSLSEKYALLGVVYQRVLDAYTKNDSKLI